MSGLVLAFAALAGAAGFGLTYLVRRYALAKAVVDVPNERSLHKVPTPRGGGLSIVISVIGAVLGLAAAGYMPWRIALGYAIGGSAVALIGWMDDHAPVRARVRAAVHFGAAAVFLWAIGGLPALAIGPSSVPLSAAGYALGVVGIVWVINLYNFMDGIDGIAGSEAAIAAGAAAAVLAWRGSFALSVLCAVLAASSMGFLGWNWSPAKIFMGDVGSGFLGFMFGALAVHGERSGDLPAVGWMILLAVFVFDATATLVRRLLRGERVYLPHKSHAYQRAVQSGLTHAQVSGLVVGANLVLAILAGAFVVLHDRAVSLAWFAVAYALVAAVYGAVERRAPMTAR